jgi:hypothetical protein
MSSRDEYNFCTAPMFDSVVVLFVIITVFAGAAYFALSDGPGPKVKMQPPTPPPPEPKNLTLEGEKERERESRRSWWPQEGRRWPWWWL